MLNNAYFEDQKKAKIVKTTANAEKIREDAPEKSLVPISSVMVKTS
jgi:hypothetical protein